MKNTLAENMLRFGVKNLKESDVKKINRAALNEINIDGVEWKYPFKDMNQVDAYMSLMAFNKAVVQSGLAMNPYNDGETLNGLAFIHQALTRATAMQGMKPGALPLEKAGMVVAQSDILPNDRKAVAANAMKTPFFSKWYTKYWLPQWKNAYMKTFGEPTMTPNPQAPVATQQPKVPGKN